MNLKDYELKIKQDSDWAPGWEAIEIEFNKAYTSKPIHLVSNLHSSLGGNDFLYGTSIYTKDNYNHMLSFGMTELFADSDLLGQEESGYGYELTVKWSCDKDQTVYQSLLNYILHHFARYTYLNNAPLGDGQSIICDIETKLQELGMSESSNIKAFTIVKDTTVNTIQTPHGTVQFLQLVGLTDEELDMVREEHWVSMLIASKLREKDTNLLFDLNRESYNWETLSKE